MARSTAVKFATGKPANRLSSNVASLFCHTTWVTFNFPLLTFGQKTVHACLSHCLLSSAFPLGCLLFQTTSCHYSTAILLPSFWALLPALLGNEEACLWLCLHCASLINASHTQICFKNSKIKNKRNWTDKPKGLHETCPAFFSLLLHHICACFLLKGKCGLPSLGYDRWTLSTHFPFWCSPAHMQWFQYGGCLTNSTVSLPCAALPLGRQHIDPSIIMTMASIMDNVYCPVFHSTSLMITKGICKESWQYLNAILNSGLESN